MLPSAYSAPLSPLTTTSLLSVSVSLLLFLRVVFLLLLFALIFVAAHWAVSRCSEQGLLFIAVCRLLIAVASLVAENRLWHAGFSSFGSRALEHRLSS